MKKKDLAFIEKYDPSSTLENLHNFLCVITPEGVIEGHARNLDGQFSYYLESLLQVYKTLHGARHEFTIDENGIHITVKKTGETTSDTLSSTESHKIPDIIPIGQITHQDIGHISMFEKMSTDLEYVSFLKHPTIISDETGTYIWGTDCIHQLRINLSKNTYENLSYYLDKKYMKIIKNFYEDSDEENYDVSIHDRQIIFSNDKHILVLPLTLNEDMLICPMQTNEEFLFNKDSLASLKEMNTKSFISANRKQVKESYEVLVRVNEGNIYVGNDIVFSLESPITLNKPIHGYRFFEYLKGCGEVYMAKGYMRSQNSYFFL